jgi:hypothetical protein
VPALSFFFVFFFFFRKNKKFFKKKEMGRTATDCRKSGGGKCVRERWSAAVSDKRPAISKDSRVQLVVIDATQTLQSINPEREDGKSEAPYAYLSASTMHADDSDRSSNCTMLQVLLDLKRSIDNEISTVQGFATIIMVAFDKPGVPLSKAPTQRRRRQVVHGKGLFKTFLKQRGIKFEAAKIEKDDLDIEVDHSEFCLRNLASGEAIIYAWIEDYEIRIKPPVFLERVSQGQAIPRFSTDDFVSVSRKLAPFSDYLQLDRRIPERWHEYMQADRANRDALIHFFCKHLLEGTSAVRLQVPVNVTVIVDGHQLKDGDLPGVVGITGVPVALSGKNGIRFYEARPDLKNDLGETDFAAFFYTDKLEPSVVKMITTDTDFIYYGLGLLLLRTLLKPAAVSIKILLFRFLPKRKLGQHSGEEWVDINRLYHEIVHDPALSCLGHAAVSSVIAAMLLAGSDFNDPFFFVPHDYFFRAFIEYARDLRAPLAFFKIDEHRLWVDPRIFSRYLSLVYGSKFMPKEGRALLGKTAHEIALEISEKQKDAQKHFPSLEDLVLARKQLLYTLLLVSDLGKPALRAVDLTQYGYGPNDGSAQLTWRNIDRLIVPTQKLQEDVE